MGALRDGRWWQALESNVAAVVAVVLLFLLLLLLPPQLPLLLLLLLPLMIVLSADVKVCIIHGYSSYDGDWLFAAPCVSDAVVHSFLSCRHIRQCLINSQVTIPTTNTSPRVEHWTIQLVLSVVFVL